MRSGPRIAIRTSAGTLGLVSGLHLFWAVGGNSGASAVIPHKDGVPLIHPSRAQTIGVATLTAGAGVLYLGAANGWRPRWLFRCGAATAGLVLIARAIGDGRSMGITKRIKGTQFARWDTAVFVPLCGALGACGVAASTL